jgi:hypothetical protein
MNSEELEEMGNFGCDRGEARLAGRPLRSFQTGRKTITVLPPQQLMQINNHGQIECLTLPTNWREGASHQGPRLEFERTFSPVPCQTAKLQLWFRGAPISDPGRIAFDVVLSKPKRILLPSEVASLSEVMGWMANDTFHIMVARVDEVGGRKVLIVEGRYIPKEIDYYAVLLQNPKAHDYIQDIYFQASKDEFPLFIKEVKQAIYNIQWMDEN